jgi:GDPmannose 4,6-dehydratase
MRALIFGSNGQDGKYLSKVLIQKEIEVIGISKNGGDIIGDITHFNFVNDIIKKFKPEYIFNFAAISNTDHEFLFKNHETISTGTLNLLESVKNNVPKSKVFISGSALQFQNKGLPIDENTPFEANSAYSTARINSVYTSRYFRSNFDLNIYIGYLFNHDSPYRDNRFINQKICQFAKKIKEGSNEKLTIDNISNKKEFGFALDIVEAIWLFVNQNNFFESVIGTGEAYSIEDWLKSCFDLIGKDWKDFVSQNQDYLNSQNSILVSNPKLIKSLNWSPKYDIKKLAKLMIESN